MSRVRKFDKSPPIVYDELALCYFTALIDAIRLVTTKALERGMPDVRDKDRAAIDKLLDGDALQAYVRHVGDRYFHTYSQTKRIREETAGITVTVGP